MQRGQDDARGDDRASAGATRNLLVIIDDNEADRLGGFGEPAFPGVGTDRLPCCDDGVRAILFVIKPKAIAKTRSRRGSRTLTPRLTPGSSLEIEERRFETAYPNHCNRKAT